DLARGAGASDPTITGTLSAARFSGNVVTPSGAVLSLNRTGSIQSGAFTLASGATYHTKLTSVAIFNQLQVSGVVNLSGALDLDVSSLSASAGQSFKLIDNQSALAVSGTFTGLPQGAQFAAGNFFFQISYTGGDGNDVVITVIGQVGVTDPLGGPSRAM